MKKSTLFCCFTWIVFIELNFTVVFQLIRKTWDVWFVGGVGEWEILRNEERVGGGGGGGLSNWGWYWNGRVDTPLQTM